MNTLSPTAVIAQWASDDNRRGFMLQANGDLVEVTRASIGEMWSPPEVIASLQEAHEPLQELLKNLVNK